MIEDAEGKLVPNPMNIQRTLLRLDARKWHIAKAVPK